MEKELEARNPPSFWESLKACLWCDSVGICTRLLLSNGNTISDNRLWDDDVGIALADSDNNSINDNRVWDNMGAGIVIGRHTFLGPGSDNNIIVNNTVFSNNYGVSLSGSINNTFANNSIVNNFRGMRSRDAGGNWIYHNNIIDNTEQASDDGSTNQWDDGYPSGGNYWSVCSTDPIKISPAVTR
jgi:parallel beta-helix repeat protein